MKIIFKILERRLEEVISAAGLAIMACCVMFQVVMRFVFHKAAPWAEEIAVYGMVAAIYFGCSLAIRERAHIRITVVLDLLPKKLKLMTVILADLLWIGFIVFLFVQSLTWIHLLFETDYISPSLGIDQKWPQMIVPISLCLMFVRLIQVYFQWFKNKDQELPL